MASFCKIFWSSYLCHLILSSTSSNLKPQIASKMLLDLSYLYIFFALKYAIYVKCDFFCLTAYSVILIMYIMVSIPFCNSNPHIGPSLQSKMDSKLFWNYISIYVRLLFIFSCFWCLEHFEKWIRNPFTEKFKLRFQNGYAALFFSLHIIISTMLNKLGWCN